LCRSASLYGVRQGLEAALLLPDHARASMRRACADHARQAFDLRSRVGSLAALITNAARQAKEVKR
jgi:D-aminopeptidase